MFIICKLHWAQPNKCMWKQASWSPLSWGDESWRLLFSSLQELSCHLQRPTAELPFHWSGASVRSEPWLHNFSHARRHFHNAAASADPDDRGLSNKDQRGGGGLVSPLCTQNPSWSKNNAKTYVTGIFKTIPNSKIYTTRNRRCTLIKYFNTKYSSSLTNLLTAERFHGYDFPLYKRSVICTPGCSAANCTAAVCCPITCSLCPMVLVRGGIWWVCNDPGLTDAEARWEVCCSPRGAVEPDLSELSWA